MIKVEISNRQRTLAIDRTILRSALRSVLGGEGYANGAISLAIVDDPTIHDLNRRFLQHDYATDVLTFVFDHDEDSVDGEIIVSADTAVRFAQQWQTTPDYELLLYVVHGGLHMAGYDDHEDEDRKLMRSRERYYLQQLGIPVPDERPSE